MGKRPGTHCVGDFVVTKYINYIGHYVCLGNVWECGFVASLILKFDSRWKVGGEVHAQAAIPTGRAF
jgi:hypothetical protein